MRDWPSIVATHAFDASRPEGKEGRLRMLNSTKNNAERDQTMHESARSFIASVASDVAAINASGLGLADWSRAMLGALTTDNRGIILGISLALISLGGLALLPRAPPMSRAAACEGLTFCIHSK